MTKNSNNSQNVISFVKRRKSNLIKVFNAKCCLCGFDKFQEALEFHHVNPEEKEFGITTETTTKALEKQLKELRKCVLLCANCHRGVHAGYYEIEEDFQKYFNEEVAERLLNELYFVNGKTEYKCKICNKPISRGAEHCEDCAKLVSRLVERPTREELKELIRNKSFTEIGSKYKVSDNAIRKWCIQENLPSKKTVIKQLSDEEWQKV